MTKPCPDSKEASSIAMTALKTAAELATKTAETNAIINTNMEWIKTRLVSIEMKLNEMDKAFVTAAQHADVLKSIDDHEARLNSLETEKTRVTLLLAVSGFILTTLIGLLVYHILQQ